MLNHLKNLAHSIIAGICAFLATIIGSICFNLQNEWYIISLGFGFFLFVNNLLYKFKFNSYHLNGVTLTTVLIFVSQAVSMIIWKSNSVKITWIFGVILIIIGVTILEKNKEQKREDLKKDQ